MFFQNCLFGIGENQILRIPSTEKITRKCYILQYFSNRDLNDLSLCGQYQDNGKGTWFDENDVEIHVGDKAIAIDKSAKIVESALGKVRRVFVHSCNV